MIILIEAVMALIAIAVVVAVFYKKNSKKVMWFTIGIGVIMLICVPLTIVLEDPKMETREVIQIQVNMAKQLSQPHTEYMFRDVTQNVKVEGNIDYSKIGTYEVEYEVPKLFGTYKQKQVVEVVDTTPPEIALEGGEEITYSYAKEYEEVGMTATDNYDGDVTEQVVVEQEKVSEEEIQIKYAVVDSQGNKATKTRKVILVDDVPPVITLNGRQNVTVIVGNAYKEEGAKAVDEKDGDLTDKIQIEGKVDTAKTGSYTITYKVADSKGNEATKTRKVTVVNKPVETPQSKGQNLNGGTAGVIYLTFDDGPSTDITPKILDILQRKNVKATFFILNYGSAKEKLVQREYNEGHTVAIHGYSHQYKEIYQSVDVYMENITKLQEKIKISTGYNCTITRFPGGSSNTVSRFNPGIMTTLTHEVVARGYKYFDWNVSSGDAGGAKSSSDVYNNVTKGLKKSRSNVVLMHDFSGNTKTLNALEDIIDFGLANGYRFEKITESTPMVTQRVNN